MAVVLLDKSQRGVGDIELRNSSADRKWVSGRDYVASTDDTNLPSGYVKYGVIYGFEKNGAAMLVAFGEAPHGTLWCETTDVTLHTVVSDNATTSWGQALNGVSNTSNKCMNVARVAYLCKTGSSNTTPTTHPTNAYYNSSYGPNSEAVFLANSVAVNLYGTYEAYIAQSRPILKSASAGVFSKRCGKANTEKLASQTSPTYPAAQYCHTYTVGGSGDVQGNWWLPDMYELAVMMEDSHYDLHRTNSGVTSGVNYWSSVVCTVAHAWYYNDYGMSHHDSFTSTWLRARPVTISE